MRRWEYAMALRALRTWKQIHPQVNVGYDVGGAGSPFSFMIRGELTVYKDFSVIDPESPYGAALDQYIGRISTRRCGLLPLGPRTCEDLDQFLYHLAVWSPGRLVVPDDGLL